tara:strand:+ start:303 stop:440 length:138 start_codon:yes stop_codon:yes gene_type:complete
VFFSLVKEFTQEGNLEPIDLGVDVLPLGRSEVGVLEDFPKDGDFF